MVFPGLGGWEIARREPALSGKWHRGLACRAPMLSLGSPGVPRLRVLRLASKVKSQNKKRPERGVFASQKA